MKKKKINYILVSIVVFLISTIFFLPEWLYSNFGKINFEQYLFNFTAKPTNGSLDTVGKFFGDFYLRYIILIFFIAALILAMVKMPRKYFKLTRLGLVLGLIGSIANLMYSIGIVEYYTISSKQGNLYQERYVDPKEVKLTFPEKKKNLIYINLESVDTSLQKYNIDGQVYNLMPNLTKLSGEYLSFGDRNNLGAYEITNTEWTAASLVAQTAGIPLIEIEALNNPIRPEEFLDGVTSLGDILKDNGYKNYFLMGSDATFGNRDVYFKNHGDYEIKDYNYQIENGNLPVDYRVFWGYEDEKMFEFAKKDLIEISKSDQPFNYSILTVDTHFLEGYLPEGYEKEYKSNYANAFKYSDHVVGEFISWLQEQDFFEDTTIIVQGDHITMNTKFLSRQAEDRRMYNLIINSSKDPINTEREYSVVDMFPTTLSAMGVDIEGDKLGLGVDLFGNEKTIIEDIGLSETEKQFRYKSDYYKEKFILRDEDEK